MRRGLPGASSHVGAQEARSRWLRGVASGTTFYPLLTLAIGAAIWEIGARSMKSILVPTFSETVLAFVRLTFDPRLWAAFIASNQAMVVGYGIALVIGVPLGFAMGRFPRLERVSNVYLNILIVLPTAAIVPLLIMSVGVGFGSRVILIVIFSVLILVIDSRAGVRQVDRELINMARSFGASEIQIWRKVLLPGAAPAVMSGVRISIGSAVEGMVISEFLLSAVGFGNLIVEFQANFDGDLMTATIIYVVLEALLLISIARRLEGRFRRTEPARRSGFGRSGLEGFARLTG